MAYTQENVKYQGRAKAKGIEGVVVIQFNVQTDGSLTEITLARGLGYGCDEESLRAVESMNHMDEKWSPGRASWRCDRLSRVRMLLSRCPISLCTVSPRKVFILVNIFYVSDNKINDL